MIKFDVSDNIRQRPNIQMTSMIDIMFINLMFFMALFVYFHFETELNISVPSASASKESHVSPGEIIVNVMRNGVIVVNQKEMTSDRLFDLLKRTSNIYPAQEIIIRADEKAFHEYIVNVLDTCAKANIWNISFATTKEK